MQRSSKSGATSLERQGIIAKVFPGIFLPFSLLPARKISPQHQTSTALLGLIWENRAKPPPPSFPAALPHIHSKTACRGALATCGALPRRSRLPPRSLLGAPHWGAAPQPAAETKPFCHFQNNQVSLLRCLAFSLVCGRIWQQGAPAGPPAVRVVGACSPVGCVQVRPRRQPRQVRPLIFS